MCGLIGMIATNGKVEKNLLQAGVKILNHRGPDYHNIWISDNKNAGLGHSRLSIIDLTTGDQPLHNENKKIHLVVNGEFYNFEQQRKTLEKKGHHFNTHTDSEIALHLYEDFGTDCLSHLRGEFAFILWDEEKKVCFAARDRFGIKPLFYSVINQTLFLASEVKALFAMGVPANWDQDSLILFSNSSLNLTSRTLFKNVYQVPPGYYLLAKQNSLQLVKYWDINYPEIDSKMTPLSTSEYIVQLRSKLEEAVKIRLRADVPVGCYLSGGLDSSTVLGIASSHSRNAIPAFTLTFEDADYDEHLIAKEMAENSGAVFHPIKIKQADLADHFVEAIWHGENFFLNGHGIAKFILSKAVRKAGYKVVLTGEGADELFAGYPHFRIDQLFNDQKNRSTAQRLKLLAHLKKTNLVSLGLLFPTDDIPTIESVQTILGFTPSWLLVSLQSTMKLSSLLSDHFKKKADQSDGFKTILDSLDVKGQLKRREPLNQSLYLWSKLRLPTYILTILGDRMEMANSIEGRLPFLDHHVAEFMRNIPVDLKVHEMTEKYLLREAARPVLTKSIYHRQKHPFLAPPVLLNNNDPFNDLLQTTLRGPTLSSIPFYDRNKVVALLDRLPTLKKTERLAWDPILMILLSTCILQQQFNLGN